MCIVSESYIMVDVRKEVIGMEDLKALAFTLLGVVAAKVLDMGIDAARRRAKKKTPKHGRRKRS